MFYKAKITNISEKTSEKAGKYISIEFTYESEEGQKKSYKNFFIAHPKKEIADKARQMLYRMRSKKTQTPQNEDNSILLNADTMIELTTTGEYTNVHTVYFIA